MDLKNNLTKKISEFEQDQLLPDNWYWNKSAIKTLINKLNELKKEISNFCMTQLILEDNYKNIMQDIETLLSLGSQMISSGSLSIDVQKKQANNANRLILNIKSKLKTGISSFSKETTVLPNEQNLIFTPLTQSNIKSSLKLINSVFPSSDQPFLEKPDFAFKISLVVQSNTIKSTFFKFMMHRAKVIDLNYWVVIDTTKNNVVGTVGLYTYSKDAAEAYWVGWLCVDPTYRGRKIGNFLIDFCINHTKAVKKKFLRLYTSTLPNEAAAQQLYEKKGLRIFKHEQIKGTKDEILYRELKL